MNRDFRVYKSSGTWTSRPLFGVVILQVFGGRSHLSNHGFPHISIRDVEVSVFLGNSILKVSAQFYFRQ
jgi:hypothetical protein